MKMKSRHTCWLLSASLLFGMCILAGASSALGAGESILWDFMTDQPGSLPNGGLLLDKSGDLYGTTNFSVRGPQFELGNGVVFELTPPAGNGQAWTETLLWNFGDTQGVAAPGGANPNGSLISDPNGNLYGTTYGGGANNQGAAFELSPPTSAGGAWTETVLWNFGSGGDGQFPSSGLLMDASGNLYGETGFGGAYGLEGAGGTVFKLTPPASSGGNWSESVLWSFGASRNDGNVPAGGLVVDASGNLYGVTSNGGPYGGGSGGIGGYGTIFELSPSANVNGAWNEAILWDFGGGGDGFGPEGVVMDGSGNLFGTTGAGGTAQFGGGTFFELSPSATGGEPWTKTIFWNFGNGADGDGPSSGPIRDASGNFYGTTSSGGAYGVGTVYKLNPPASDAGWTESILWSFGNTATDGTEPLGALTMDASGNLYGSTSDGGDSDGEGIVYEITNAVSTGAEIYVKPRLIRFPTTAIGSTSTVAIGIRNTGNGQLTGSVSPPSAPFGISGSGNFSLAPRSETTIALTFTPAATGPARQFGTIASNSTRNSTAPFGMAGMGRR